MELSCWISASPSLCNHNIERCSNATPRMLEQHIRSLFKVQDDSYPEFDLFLKTMSPTNSLICVSHSLGTQGSTDGHKNQVARPQCLHHLPSSLESWRRWLWQLQTRAGIGWAPKPARNLSLWLCHQFASSTLGHQGWIYERYELGWWFSLVQFLPRE